MLADRGWPSGDACSGRELLDDLDKDAWRLRLRSSVAEPSDGCEFASSALADSFERTGSRCRDPSRSLVGREVVEQWARRLGGSERDGENGPIRQLIVRALEWRQKRDEEAIKRLTKDR